LTVLVNDHTVAVAEDLLNLPGDLSGLVREPYEVSPR
jgi:hypothetical protein